jgi:hypothetical protein
MTLDLVPSCGFEFHVTVFLVESICVVLIYVSEVFGCIGFLCLGVVEV